MTRWLSVCVSDTQPAMVDGLQLDCTAAGGTWQVLPVDTVITESSPLLNLGQLLAMTPDEALIISAAIALVWAVAWGFRAVAHAVFNPSDRSQDD